MTVSVISQPKLYYILLSEWIPHYLTLKIRLSNFTHFYKLNINLYHFMVQSKLNKRNLRRIESWVWSLGELLMNHYTYRRINHEFILVKLYNNITSPIMLYDDL